jgi:acetyl-CoA decarbonylase/synthase complex subunit epsilon
MMPGRAVTGQIGEIPGPKKAAIFPSADVVISMIRKASRPLFVIGSEATQISTNDGDLIDTAVRLLNNPSFTVVATGHLISEFMKRKNQNAHSMQLMNLGDRLRDPNWSGFDGNGPYDLVVFVAFPYYLEWLVLSGLKNFVWNLNTISLDNTYQPNAAWSIGMMPEREWKDTLEKIVSALEVNG